MTVHQWHDWQFCQCCGFTREVLVVEVGDLVETECTECGFAWTPEPDPGAGPQTPQP